MAEKIDEKEYLASGHDGQSDRRKGDARDKRVLFGPLPVICQCSDPYASQRRRNRKCCDVAVCVRVLWTGLSLIVTLSCCFSFSQPYWLTNTAKRSTFGLYSYCIQDNYVEAVTNTGYVPAPAGANSSRDIPEVSAERAQYVVHYRESCSAYGQYFRLAHLPSNSWQIACVLFGAGCFLQAFGAIAALATSVMADWWASRFAGYTGYIQTMGVMTCAGGILTFPLGLDSNFVRHYCSDSRMFYAGDCHMGWAFTLGIMGTALSVFCPFLSQYVTFRIIDETGV